MRRRPTLLVLTTALIVSSVSGAQPRPSAADAVRFERSAVYTLERCLELAERNYPKIAEAVAKLDKMDAQVKEARTAPFSEFEATAGAALAPGLRGTAVYSPNNAVSLNRGMALAWRAGVEGAIPLWTFGKIRNVIRAAEAQVDVGEHAVQKAKNEVKLSVRKAFYGIQFARDVLALVDEARGRIDKHLSSLEERVREGEGDDIELLKLKMQRAELEARSSEAEEKEKAALAGLRFLTGVEGPFDIPNEPLEQMGHTLGPLSRYLSAAKLFRPEVNMAHAGVLARRAQLELQRARYYPDLALGLSAQVSRAPGMADQVNPFARDLGNYTFFGVGLVLKWKLDFLPQSARVEQANADLQAMRAQEQFALGGVGVEVREAFAAAQAAKKRVVAYSDATHYAKQWLIKIQQGIDVGVFEDEDIVDPAKEYALKKFELINATFEYNMALAKLALASGWSAVAAPTSIGD